MRPLMAFSMIVIVLAIGAAQVTSAQNQPASAQLGGAVMPELGSPAMPTVPDLKQAAQLDAEIIVATTGSIAHTRILKSTDPTGALEKACLEAMRGWHLKPAMSSGYPIATLVQIHFDAAAPSANGTPGLIKAELHPIVELPQPATTASSSPAPAQPGQTGVSWPKVVREIRPSYTAESMRAKLQGTVELQIVVLPDGTVGSARVTKGLAPDLDQAAMVAARHWLFEPAMKDGQPVAAQVGLVLEFRLH